MIPTPPLTRPEAADAGHSDFAALTATHAPSARDPVADDWLTPKEVAAYRKVPVSWVRENARRGKLRSHKLGHYVRFRRSELDEDLRALERRVRGV